jgi:DNA-binding Lrp family transcriptional regulator
MSDNRQSNHTTLCHKTVELSSTQKIIINLLQRGLPLVEKPFADIAEQLSLSEEQVIAETQQLLEQGILTRFGPMYDAACLGGAFTLAAIAVPEQRFAEVAAIVNGFEQVAHNYQREHKLNMWFVLGTETSEEITQVIAAIEQATGLTVVNLPKEEEFYVGLYLPA